jgi:pyruvate formate lyase activating enzyme
MVKGWLRTTLIDFPGQIATVLFLGGCNMRCPMCHNPDLVLGPAALPEIHLESILAYLDDRKGKITGVVISGGEPCLTADLIPLLETFNRKGLAIKLDTNGYYPQVLGDILNQDLVDYVAMDIKAPPAKYARLSGLLNMDLDRIQASIDLIANSGVDYEFRTTVVPALLTEADISIIARWLPQGSKYILQQFRSQGCLDPEFEGLTPYPAETLLRMQTLAAAHLGEVSVRGI